MRMSRDVEIIAAAVFSAERPGASRIKHLSDIELAGASAEEIDRFVTIARYLAVLPDDIQAGLSAAIQISNDTLERADAVRLFRTPQPISVKGRVSRG